MAIHKNKMDELRKQYGAECQNCGSKEDLQFAHVFPTKLCGKNSRGSSERYYDIKKNPSAYVLLCVTCHNRIGPSPVAMQKMKKDLQNS